MTRLRVLNSAMGGNIVNGEFLRPILKDLDMQYVTMSEWDEHDIKWSEKTWLLHVEKADIVVCPQNVALQPSKSNNRVTQAMALGRPVVASPLQAYKEVIRHGENGFICETDVQWTEALKALKDAAVREKIGVAAKADVTEKYSLKTIASEWKGLLKNLSLENCSPPKCDIIIPTWNNLKYLKVCVESIRANTDWPHNRKSVV